MAMLKSDRILWPTAWCAAALTASLLIIGFGNAHKLQPTLAPSPGSLSRGALSRVGQCNSNQVPLGYIAQLRPGESPSRLTAEGYRVFAALAATHVALAQPAPGSLIAVSTGTSSGAAVLIAALKGDPAIEAAGAVFPHTATAGLTSCDDQLADVPAAARYVTSAEAAIETGGFATAAQLHDGLLMLSDDPIDSSKLLLTAAIPDPTPVSPAPAPGIVGHSLQAIVVVLDRTSYAANAIGWGAWYQGSPSG